MKHLRAVRSVTLWSLALLPLPVLLASWLGAGGPNAEEVNAGEVLFRHEWQPEDPLCAGGDGLGPVFNARSCVACHNQGGVGGSGGAEHNVTVFVLDPKIPGQRVRTGVLHREEVLVGDQETLHHIHPALPAPAHSPALGTAGAAFVITDGPISNTAFTGDLVFDSVGPPGKTSRVGPVADSPALPGVAVSTTGLMAPALGQGPLAATSFLFPGTPAGSFPPGPEVTLSERRTPALFGAGLLDGIPDEVILANEAKQRQRVRPHDVAAGSALVEFPPGFRPPQREEEMLPIGRALRLPDGRVGRFGWKAQTATLAEFVQAACASELGLGNPNQPQPEPLSRPGYRPVGFDLTQQQCDQITAFVASLPRPRQHRPADSRLQADADAGKALFRTIGCADCHTPTLGAVEGIYSDLLLHRMGSELSGAGFSYGGPRPSTPGEQVVSVQGVRDDEWRTPPLWGVADSAPYLHDGRAATLEQAIQAHGGQGAAAAASFQKLSGEERSQVLSFLRTLRAP